MNGITKLSIGRPIATSMVFLIFITLGVVSFRSLPVDLLPSIEFTSLTVFTSYPNVGPEEIEQVITDPVENAVSGLPNLEQITSRSEEGVSRVSLQFTRGTNVDEAANDLRAALDDLRAELPLEAEVPRIWKLDLDRSEVVGIAVTTTRPLEELTRLLEDDLARRFEQIPGVGTIEVRGGVHREIRVDLLRDRLAAAGLTALDVRDALVRENLTAPGGNVKDGFEDLYVRAVGEYATLDEIGRTVIRNTEGLPLRVRDVATVSDDYEDVRWLVDVNGLPSVSLGIQKQSGANTVAVADAVRAEVARINAEREDLHLSILSDQSEFIRQSIDSVRSSALWGSLLAVVVLYLFLRNRSSTAIIALSIPISVISTFALLYFGGLTLNQMTFGGLALGVGLIVDNAIVVLESIVRKREEQSMPPHEAAALGTSEVAGAIVASTLTSCVIFLPVVFTRSTSGALFQALALVVVFALACSLLVALTLVPMLAARFLSVRSRSEPQGKRSQLTERLESTYSGILSRALDHRLVVFAATAVLLAGALALFPTIPVELAPQSDADEIDISLEMAQGTNIAVMMEYLAELEQKVLAVLPSDDVEFSTTEVWGSNASLELKLVPQEDRTMSSSALADAIRRDVEHSIPGAEIRVDAQPGMWILRRVFSSGGGDEAVQLQLRGWDLERSDALASIIRKKMEALPGITGVRVSRREGQPQENLLFDRDRIAELGLSVQEVARTVQANVGGVEAGRLRDGGDEYPIVVRLRSEDRLTASDLDAVSLTTPAGIQIPLSTVVDRQRDRGPSSIQRVDGQRVAYITASLESGLALGDAVERVRADLSSLELPAGFSLFFGGQYEEQQKSQRDFFVAILMALALVYMLMAAQFERFIDPLIVMVAVPVALVGVVPTLLLTGTTLNLQSVMGLVMLIGIVVNNAIVLVDTINLLRRETAMALRDAVAEASRLRLRPILMTTLTTVLGLAPLALGIGPGAEIQAALARVVIGGLTASTLVTLVLIPLTYSSLVPLAERLRESSWLGKREAADDVPLAQEL
ncbi:MAG: efflux RND transporter permease subunit [Acidobacteriota bacterium]